MDTTTKLAIVAAIIAATTIILLEGDIDVHNQSIQTTQEEQTYKVTINCDQQDIQTVKVTRIHPSTGERRTATISDACNMVIVED